jgi:4-amino-4-deoxy-L-arabinose transferase-like glycosyltransferase
MAALHRLTGRREAAFYAVPLLGALAVWMTAWLGARLHNALTGFSASALLATSPSFLYQITQPVSDVPATAWWTASLALAICPGALSAFGAGTAAAMAVLTRPNLVPFAALIGAYFAWDVWRPSRHPRRVALNRLALFVAGVAPGCLAVAAINHYLFGSPLRSGYGSLNELYAWTSVRPNLSRYSQWLVETESPLILLALATPWFWPHARSAAQSEPNRDVHRESLLLLGCALLVVGSYLPWGVFESWDFLRFLLPAFPPLIVLSVIVITEVLRFLPWRRSVALAITIGLLGCWGAWQVREALNRGVTTLRQDEQRYLDVSRYIGFAMARESAFIAGLHSGSIRYHAGRPTLNFGRLDRASLDAAVAGLRARGYRPYIVVEKGEEPAFRERFGDHSRLGALDWPPISNTSRGVSVRIYDPADRNRFLAGEPIATVDMLFLHRSEATFRERQ